VPLPTAGPLKKERYIVLIGSPWGWQDGGLGRCIVDRNPSFFICLYTRQCDLFITWLVALFEQTEKRRTDQVIKNKTLGRVLLIDKMTMQSSSFPPFLPFPTFYCYGTYSTFWCVCYTYISIFVWAHYYDWYVAYYYFGDHTGTSKASNISESANTCAYIRYADKIKIIHNLKYVAGKDTILRYGTSTRHIRYGRL